MEKLQITFFILFLLILPQIIFAQKKSVDLIIQNGTIVTMNAQRRIIENGAIAVSKSEITAVGTAAEINRQYSSRETINAQGKVVIPGLINAHTHIPMTLFRGIADDLDLQEWLTKYIFPAESKNVTEDFVRVGTRLGLAEMIRGGTTTYCDMYYFEDAVADETFKAGVRGVLGETIIRFPVADNKTPEEALAYSERYINKWKNNALIVPALAPHAPYTLTTEQLQAVRKLADRLNATTVIHVAETQTEVDDITKQYGSRPVEYLEKIGFLNNRTIAAHAVFANENEIEILKRRGVGVAHNPQSNMKLASGVAPVPSMLARDLALGLGTDSAASNNDLNMWEEMDTAAKLHKVFTRDPKVVTAEQSFAMATIGGASALHLEKIIGSIEAGKRADIVIVDFDNPHQTPMYNVYSHLVYATKASDVRHVIINGKVVMRDRVLLTLNENAIKKDANLYREKIIKSLSTN
ncbi:MAG TPA: amidohydrolase [Pyrinomonadaceae bacterium]|jgi:5-methylthioadenosine/S-adenosylhomocysteine deaminase